MGGKKKLGDSEIVQHFVAMKNNGMNRHVSFFPFFFELGTWYLTDQIKQQ